MKMVYFCAHNQALTQVARRTYSCESEFAVAAGFAVECVREAGALRVASVRWTLLGYTCGSGNVCDSRYVRGTTIYDQPDQVNRLAWMGHTEGEQVRNNIAGKVVVITGASSGLGEATARLLSAEGATVVLGARRTDRLESLVDELTAGGGKALAVTTDVTRYDQVKHLVDRAVQTYGRIDVMINNAGVMPRAPLDRLTIEDWDRAIDVNIKGVLYGISAALPYMEEQKSGHIINVSSVSGHKIGREFSVYSATKFAVRALSEGLRMEVKPYNIRTTIISPGVITTELPQSITQPDIAEKTQKVYDDLAIPPDSFARAVVYAMSQPDDVDINEILFRPTRQEG